MAPILTQPLSFFMEDVIIPLSTPSAFCHVVALVEGIMSVVRSAAWILTITFPWLKQEPGSLTRCSVKPGVASWDVVIHHAQ